MFSIFAGVAVYVWPNKKSFFSFDYLPIQFQMALEQTSYDRRVSLQGPQKSAVVYRSRGAHPADCAMRYIAPHARMGRSATCNPSEQAYVLSDIVNAATAFTLHKPPSFGAEEFVEGGAFLKHNGELTEGVENFLCVPCGEYRKDLDVVLVKCYEEENHKSKDADGVSDKGPLGQCRSATEAPMGFDESQCGYEGNLVVRCKRVACVNAKCFKRGNIVELRSDSKNLDSSLVYARSNEGFAIIRCRLTENADSGNVHALPSVECTTIWSKCVVTRDRVVRVEPSPYEYGVAALLKFDKKLALWDTEYLKVRHGFCLIVVCMVVERTK